MVKVIARLSGVVSYSDGSHGAFAVHLDERGNVSYNGKPVPLGDGVADGRQALREVDSEQSWLDDMLAPLAGLACNPAGTPAKTVTGLNAEFSGRVTVDSPDPGKPTWEDFIVQFTTKRGDGGPLGAAVPSGGTAVGSGDTSAWVKAKATAALKARLNSMFNLGSSGNLGLVVS